MQLVKKPEQLLLALASVLMLLAGILTNLPALILGRLVDRMIGQTNSNFTVALPFLGLIIGIILVREVLTIIRKYLIENIATQTEKKQTVAVIEHLLRGDIATLGEQQIGSLHGRIFRSIQGLVRMIKLAFLEFLPVFFSALAAITIALWQKPFLATIMVLVIPTSLFIIIKQIGSQKGIRVQLLRGKEKIDGAVVEMLGGIETVRVLDTVKEEIEKVEQVAEESRKKEIRHHIAMALFDSVKYLDEGFFYIVVISLSIFLSAQGIISRGDILVYSILFMSITGPLREMHRILDQAHESSLLVNDLFGLLAEPIDESFRTSLTDKRFVLPPSDTFLQIKQLSFTYANRNASVLDNITITIRQGEKIGFAGASGCGKTTLIKILLRLIHGYSGEIYLFGKNLKEVTREEIAEKVAYVPQRTYIFSGTIWDNIIYGCQRSDINQEEVIDAARKAHIYSEIMDDLGGLEGKVTENGNNLSGGQKQRLAIARLILKSPELFIFDEATSALDNTNETLVQKSIEELFQHKTMITIAHRLQTLENCHRIFVMDKGRIVQEGAFASLAKNPGLFMSFLQQRELPKQKD